MRRVWCLTFDDAEAIKAQHEGAYILEVKPPISRLSFCEWLNALELRREETDDEVWSEE